MNYQRNDWRVRRASLPSLLQMDIIKPLAGEWGLMTPSGPILGLNKWRKIKLRSKLQPACSCTVYQQCAWNQGGKKGLAVFLHSSVVVYASPSQFFLFRQGKHRFLSSIFFFTIKSVNPMFVRSFLHIVGHRGNEVSREGDVTGAKSNILFYLFIPS